MGNPSKEDRHWLGTAPLRTFLNQSETESLSPKTYVSHVYQEVGNVLESLWEHYLKHESFDVGTLLLSSDANYFSYLLEKNTNGFFNSQESLSKAKNYFLKASALEYPGHSTLCLFMIARSSSNEQLMLSSKLCESIAKCLQQIESYLNHDDLQKNLDLSTLPVFLKRWKQAFPYSE